eukprot:GHRQ01015857.1.p1 GENE.GHRQ01015857.1~~GHRQ01015857.1.p1  ORF type:complete len:148 (-),score=30.88 GHRQ01015857.1:453-896(-)
MPAGTCNCCVLAVNSTAAAMIPKHAGAAPVAVARRGTCQTRLLLLLLLLPVAAIPSSSLPPSHGEHRHEQAAVMRQKPWPTPAAPESHSPPHAGRRLEGRTAADEIKTLSTCPCQSKQQLLQVKSPVNPGAAATHIVPHPAAAAPPQ